MRWTTLTEHILKEEQKIPGATGRLTLLLNQLSEATKIIAAHVKKSGLVDIEGQTGETNVFNEEVQKLDKFSNDLLIDILTESGQVSFIASEELERPIEIKGSGEYMVFMDPLDGSSNIDTNVSIGTIFSIYHSNNNSLQPGNKQVAAGYVVYGSSVILVYSCGKSVNGFTLDPGVGSFLLSHPNIKLPTEHSEYSINEGYFNLYKDSLKAYLQSLKNSEAPYKLRYTGSMVADIHRILIKGGIFLYPNDSKNPQGKLRLMFEVNPISLLVTRAGGMVVSKGQSPLEITPASLQQRVPVVLGSRKEVEKYLRFMENKE